MGATMRHWKLALPFVFAVAAIAHGSAMAQTAAPSKPAAAPSAPAAAPTTPAAAATPAATDSQQEDGADSDD
jgi:hypothetical protein